MKLFFYDLETTGLDCERHGIHQISGAIVIDGETKEEFNFKVQPNPYAVIDEEALKIAGVTKEEVMAYEPMQDVYKKIVAMLGKYVNKFDKKDKFFREFFAQNRDMYFGSWFWSNSFDVMVLATPYLASCRADMANFKLSTVADTLGIKVEEDKLHDAMYDIYLTKAIFDIVCRFS